MSETNRRPTKRKHAAVAAQPNDTELRLPVAVVVGAQADGLKTYALHLASTIGADKMFVQGDYPVFVEFADLKREPQSGDIVHLERRRGTLTETSVRRVRSTKGGIKFSPTVPKVPKESVKIVGLCIGLYRPASLPG